MCGPGFEEGCRYFEGGANIRKRTNDITVVFASNDAKEVSTKYCKGNVGWS